MKEISMPDSAMETTHFRSRIVMEGTGILRIVTHGHRLPRQRRMAMHVRATGLAFAWPQQSTPPSPSRSPMVPSYLTGHSSQLHPDWISCLLAGLRSAASTTPPLRQPQMACLPAVAPHVRTAVRPLRSAATSSSRWFRPSSTRITSQEIMSCSPIRSSMALPRR